MMINIIIIPQLSSCHALFSSLCDRKSLLFNVKLLHPSISEHHKAFFVDKKVNFNRGPEFFESENNFHSFLNHDGAVNAKEEPLLLRKQFTQPPLTLNALWAAVSLD